MMATSQHHLAESEIASQSSSKRRRYGDATKLSSISELNMLGRPCGGERNWPRADQSVQLPFGQNPEGRIVHVSEVANGLSCRCVCSGCGSQLVAKNRGSRQPHFAHYSTAECAGALETAIHKLAKQAIAEAKRIMLPAIEAVHGEQRVFLRGQRACVLNEVVYEQRMGSIQPDIVARWGDRQVLIEVMVTHECEPEKLEYLRTNELSAFEVDLSDLARNATMAEITRQILDDAPRKWLFHPLKAAKEHTLREKAEVRAKQARQRMASKKAAALAQRKAAAQLFAASYRLQTTDDLSKHSHVLEIEDAGLSSTLRKPEAGENCFAVPYQAWQSELIFEYVVKDRPYFSRGFSTDEAIALLEERGLVTPVFVRFPIEPGLVEEIRLLVPDFSSPRDTVDAFIRHLGAMGILQKKYPGWDADEHHQFEARDKALAAGYVRKAIDTLVTTVNKLAEAIPIGTAFDPLHWLNSPHGKYVPTPLEVAKLGTPLSQALGRDLERLIAMLKPGGKPVDDLLDFPFHTERAARQLEQAEAEASRKAEAERAALESAALEAGEARERRAKLLRSANLYLPMEQANAWFSSRLINGNVSVLNAVGLTENEYLVEDTALSRELDRRANEHRAKTQAAPFREALIAEATALFHHADTAEFWVNHSNSYLGAKPIDYCVDQVSKERCLSVLRATLPKKRR